MRLETAQFFKGYICLQPVKAAPDIEPDIPGATKLDIITSMSACPPLGSLCRPRSDILASEPDVGIMLDLTELDPVNLQIGRAHV